MTRSVNPLRKAHLLPQLAIALALLLPISLSLTPQHGLEIGVAQAQAQALSDYAENKATDLFLRGQAFTAPATAYFFLSTTACSDSSVGTEVTGAVTRASPSLPI